jgi:hypothetical protein
MILKTCKILSFGTIVAIVISACTNHSTVKESKTTNENITNCVSAMPSEASPFLKTNTQTGHYLESFTPETKRNERVADAIKKAVATNRNDNVQAFHEFVSHWQLRWPVVKEGASGEGGIGFVWNKDLGHFQGGADATAIIEDRYTLQIILDCNVSQDCKIVEFPNLRFSFGEVQQVQIWPGGGSDIQYNTDNGKWFGLKEWEQLKKENWDFSKIGISIISNAPIPRIHEAFD